MPRATGNQKRSEVCGSTFPTGEEKHLFPWQLPHLTTVQSAFFGASGNQPSSRFPAIYLICLMTTSLQSKHLKRWKPSMLPRVVFWGQCEDPWKEKSLFCHLLQFPNLVEFPKENIQQTVSPGFILHLGAASVLIASSYGSWGSDKWPSGSLSLQKISRDVIQLTREKERKTKTK